MLEYEFETVQCDYGAGYSLFGGFGLEDGRAPGGHPPPGGGGLAVRRFCARKAAGRGLYREHRPDF